MLAQTSSRERELAIRAALGASRWRLIRQSLSEASLLTLIGCAAGLAFGAWSLRLLVALFAGELLPFFIMIKLDWRVLGFTIFISLLTGIAFGLMPALRGSALD